MIVVDEQRAMMRKEGPDLVTRRASCRSCRLVEVVDDDFCNPPSFSEMGSFANERDS